MLPPNKGHGCESGLDGIPNTNTALAPKGAISHGPAVGIQPCHQRPTQATAQIPNAIPTTTRTASTRSMPKTPG
ncbi:hypothetical protein GCM10027395_26730 [Giesbergeria sinuosa]